MTAAQREDCGALALRSARMSVTAGDMPLKSGDTEQAESHLDRDCCSPQVTGVSARRIGGLLRFLSSETENRLFASPREAAAAGGPARVSVLVGASTPRESGRSQCQGEATSVAAVALRR
jgi:hypothetical protein